MNKTDTKQSRSNKDRLVVRGLVECGGRVLVMRRNKHGNEYMVLPGGGVDAGEDLAAAVTRELLEETSVVVSPAKELTVIPYSEENDFPKTHIYICDYERGIPKLHPDSEEFAENEKGQNTYKPCWVSLEEAKENLVPIEARECLG